MEDAMPAAKAAKRVRKTPQEKQAILRFLREGGSAEVAAARFGVTCAAITKLLQSRERPLSGDEFQPPETGSSTDTASGDSDAPSGEAEVEADGTPTPGKRSRSEAVPASDSAATEDEVAMTSTKVAATEDSPAPKRVRKSKEEKLAILQFVEQGGTQVAAAERFGVSRTAVTKMVKEREAIIAKTLASPATSAHEQQTVATEATGGPNTAATTANTSGLAASFPAPPSHGDSTFIANPAVSSVELGAREPPAAVAPASTAGTGQTPPPTRPRKGKRVRKTNLEKMEILAFVDQGGSQGAAAEKFGVSRTAVTKMVKERTAIQTQAMAETSTTSRKVLQYQHKLSIIEDMLHKWQIQVELDVPGLKITGDLLQSKAMEFRNKILADYSNDLADDVVLSLTDFKASNGWLHRYMQRRSIRSLPRQPRQQPLPLETTAARTTQPTSDQRVERIREQLLTVQPSCIWNLDELALRHRTVSTRLDCVINIDARRLERISVAMAVSASGEKLPLQVVGKDPQPPSLKGVDTLETHGIQYRGHCRAWHDSYAIVEFIQMMNTEAKNRKQVWYLVLDSCAAHVAAAHALCPSVSHRSGFRFDAIVLLFLPPGSTSATQPLHQGIIRSFKLQFRRRMLQTLLHEHAQWAASTPKADTEHQTDSGVDAVQMFDVHAHTHLRNTMLWLQGAWEAVSGTAIRRAWSSCLYLPARIPGEGKAVDAASATDKDESDNEETVCADLLANVTAAPTLRTALGLDGLDTVEQLVHELVDFDKAEPSGSDEVAKDDEIVMESLSSQGLLRDAQKVLDEFKDDELQILSLDEACAAAGRLLRFMTRDSDSTLTVSERRTARANVLILQRLLLKARARENERATSADFTV